MSKFMLNTKEILYLASLTGAAEFIGINDGFYGMDEFQIRQELINLQSSLETKGYAEMDFNGNFTPHEKIMSAIGICADCTRYISVNKDIAGCDNEKLLIYLSENNIAELRQLSNDEYELNIISLSDVKDRIIGFIGWDNKQNEKIDNGIVVPLNVLAEVKLNQYTAFDEQSGRKYLMQNGCNSEQASLINNGLTNKADYYGIYVINFNKNAEDSFRSFTMIISADGAMEIVADSKNKIEFIPVDFEGLCEKVEAILEFAGVEGVKEVFQ